MRISRDRLAASRNRFGRVTDRDLAARYWEARGELERLRTPRLAQEDAVSAVELAGNFQRIRELDALCAQLWQESQRRTMAGSIEAYA
jgi:hypothetical protein